MGFPEGFTISQSVAIAATIGKQLGLSPSDAADEARAMQLCLDVVDLNAELSKEATERINKFLNLFDSSIKDNGYMLDSGLSYADFVLCWSLATLAQKQAAGKFADIELPAKLQTWMSETMA